MIYIPSCANGLRNFEMAKLENTRNVDIPIAHMGIKKKKRNVFINGFSTSVFPR